MNLPNPIIREILAIISYRDRIRLYSISKLWYRVLQSIRQTESIQFYDQIKQLGGCVGPICLDYSDKVKYKYTVSVPRQTNKSNKYTHVRPNNEPIYIRNLRINVPSQDIKFIQINGSPTYYANSAIIPIVTKVFGVTNTTLCLPISPKQFLKIVDNSIEMIIEFTKEIPRFQLKYDIYVPNQPNDPFDYFNRNLYLKYFGNLLYSKPFKLINLPSKITHLIFNLRHNTILSVVLTDGPHRIKTDLIQRFEDWHIIKFVPDLFARDISQYCIDCSKPDIMVELELQRSDQELVELYCMFVH